MAHRVDRHLDEETAELYAQGRLSARTAAPIEAHLLICEPCRRILADADAYVAIMRKAAGKLRNRDGSPGAKPRTKPTGKASAT
jgi:anti-sigma factor ChrR (cupin superfamily)